MPIIVDRQMRERIPHDETAFPIAYFENELSELPGRAGPLHWHPDFEIARAETGTLEYQVGRSRFLLQAGDSVFVNGNVLHSVRQVSGDAPDPLPVIAFSAGLIAPEPSAIYQKYIAPIAGCTALPFVVFRRQDARCAEIHRLLEEIFASMKQCPPCYEMTVQRDLNRLFAALYLDFASWPKTPATRVQLRTQIRVQQMLAFIYEHYAEPLTLDDIARAASISRSEAARCFHEYMDCSPVTALIRYRLRTAHRLLHDTTLTVQQISSACGFCTTNYFGRQFRQFYGYAPSAVRKLGK